VTTRAIFASLGGPQTHGHSGQALRFLNSFRRFYVELPRDQKGRPVDSEGTLEISLDVLLEVTSMAKVPEIIPITDLRLDAAAALKHVKESRQPVVITQRGRAAAVLVSMEAYERIEHERHLLHLLARGEQEIRAGRGFDLDGVFAEADAILAGGPK
jgi:prevent-host-death family protein